uniref:Short transient receptor potential channel 4-like n=1 Tax=Phallusia mammillata TaxID=59560 RepID=A0A6F9DVW8_9ASCI|nr:short transient receptor potential channel 4-like [Phallusia mammillata]
MITNILEFLFIFGLVVVAFALSLSELYWYYGTPAAKKLFCPLNNSTSGAQCTKNVLFSNVRESFGTLYWAIFGQFDLSLISLSGRHFITEGVAWSLIALYHVVVILVMINMLIAMMSQSYDETSTNAEVEWKLHRAAVWLRFIRKENSLPPPMNVIPNIPKWISKLKCSRKCNQPETKKGVGTSYGEKLRKEAISMLLERYKYNTHLTK